MTSFGLLEVNAALDAIGDFDVIGDSIRGRRNLIFDFSLSD